MSTPTQVSTGDTPPRPTHHIRADGTRGRRIQYPPAPRPTPKAPSYAHLQELCAIWNFKRYEEQPAEHFDRAETYLYDMSTGPWGSEASRKWFLHCAMLEAIQVVITMLGFTGMSTAAKTQYTFTAHYTNDDDIPVLPEWLHGIVRVQKQHSPLAGMILE
jgi:hypothetical protein